jgi:hypothetical protein
MRAAMSPRFVYLVVYILAYTLFPPQLLVQGDATVTITAAPAYSQQRPCAQDCFVWVYVAGVNTIFQLAGNLGCDLNTLENGCFCRPDLESQATSFLSECVSASCTGNTAVDIQTAQSIYLDYCSNNGYTPATATPAGGAPANTQQGSSGKKPI